MCGCLFCLQMLGRNVMTWTLLALTATDSASAINAANQANTAIQNLLDAEHALYQTPQGSAVTGELNENAELVREQL